MKHGLCVLSAVILVAAVAPAAEAGSPQGEYAIATLDQALASGEIDEATHGLYLLYLLHAPERLPAAYRRPLEPGLRCGTGLTMQALRELRHATRAMRLEGHGLLADPPPVTAGSIDSDSLPIRVYYQERGDLPLAENLLPMLEEAYQAHLDLGWTAPMGLDGETITTRLDVYVIDLEYSGNCVPLDDNPDTPRTDALVRCNISRFETPDFLRGTAFHEIDHAFQFTEDAIEFMSSWEMFDVHTTLNLVPDDPYWMFFIPSFQSDPHYPFFLPSMTNSYFHYGSALFPEFIDQRYGDGDASLAPRLWQAARQDGRITIETSWGYPSPVSSTPNEPDVLDAIDDVLQTEHGTSLQEALVEFAEWRLLLGDYDDGAHFAEGATWRGAEVSFAEIYGPNDLPAVDQMVTQLPRVTGTSYVRVDTGTLEGSELLRLGVTVSDDTEWAVQVFRIMDGAPAEITRVPLEALAGEVTVAAAGAEAVVLAATVIGMDGVDADTEYLPPDHEFTYTIELVAQPTVTAIEPAIGTAGVTAMPVTVTASPLAPDATLDLGQGITVNGVAVDDDRLTATIDIALDAAPGPRDVSVTNPGSDPGVLAGGFTVEAPPAPAITGVDPSELEPGQTADLTVTGAGFLAGAQADLGDGVTIDSAEVASSTELVLSVTVDDAATPGPRDLTITNPGGNAATLADAFEILDAGGDGGPDGGPGDGDDESGCNCSQAGGSSAAPRGAPLLLAGLMLALLRRR